LHGSVLRQPLRRVDDPPWAPSLTDSEQLADCFVNPVTVAYSVAGTIRPSELREAEREKKRALANG
jgi:hypothetical protein